VNIILRSGLHLTLILQLLVVLLQLGGPSAAAGVSLCSCWWSLLQLLVVPLLWLLQSLSNENIFWWLMSASAGRLGCSDSSTPFARMISYMVESEAPSQRSGVALRYQSSHQFLQSGTPKNPSVWTHLVWYVDRRRLGQNSCCCVVNVGAV
jgi:hypothetical protein